VLCIDCDLEAPGLAFYFETWPPEPAKGLVEYRGSCLAWEEFQYALEVTGTESRLSLIPAGSKDDKYLDVNLRPFNAELGEAIARKMTVVFGQDKGPQLAKNDRPDPPKRVMPSAAIEGTKS
jgi:hypothetical protein